MNWVINFLKSSIGQKVIMSLSGLFLILFLVIHLLGNLQLLKNDNGVSFNAYAYFMTQNPVIKIISYSLYLTIIIHSIQGTILFLKNRKSKGESYSNTSRTGKTWASRYMMHLGTIIFIFLAIHLYQFWLQMKMGTLPMITIPPIEVPIADLYTPCMEVFSNLAFVVFYILSMLILSFHLYHGFSSAFQSLGLNHKKYTSFIHLLGMIYSIIIPLGFAIIPLWIYFTR